MSETPLYEGLGFGVRDLWVGGWSLDLGLEIYGLEIRGLGSSSAVPFDVRPPSLYKEAFNLKTFW
jgi:hypothetical protein